MTDTKKTICPSHPNPLCPMKEGKGRCGLCDYDFSFSGQKFDRESRNVFWELARVEGEKKKENLENQIKAEPAEREEADRIAQEAYLKLEEAQKQADEAKQQAAWEAAERQRQEEEKTKGKEKNGVPGWAWGLGVVALCGLVIVLIPGEKTAEPVLPAPIKLSATAIPASAIQVTVPKQVKSAPEPAPKAAPHVSSFTKSDGPISGAVTGGIVVSPNAVDKNAVHHLVDGIAGSPLLIIYQPDDGLLSDYAPYQNGIRALSDYLATHPSTSLRLEGHTDQRKSSEHSLELAQRYADNVMQYLVSQGFDPARIFAVSYGNERPLDQGQNRESWAKNRRVAIRPY